MRGHQPVTVAQFKKPWGVSFRPGHISLYDKCAGIFYGCVSHVVPYFRLAAIGPYYHIGYSLYSVFKLQQPFAITCFQSRAPAIPHHCAPL